MLNNLQPGQSVGHQTVDNFFVISRGTVGLNSSGYSDVLTYTSPTVASAVNASIAIQTISSLNGVVQNAPAGQTIGNVDFFGSTTNGLAYAANIDVNALGAWTPTSTPTQLVLNATASGSTIPVPALLTGTLATVSAGNIYGKLTVAAVATVGAATLTAAQLVGGVILRSGSTAAYTDTTDTAANIVAAIQGCQIGTAFQLRITNTVAFIDTIAAGAGVTLAGTTAIAASTYRDFVGVVTNVVTPAVTLTGTGSGTL